MILRVLAALLGLAAGLGLAVPILLPDRAARPEARSTAPSDLAVRVFAPITAAPVPPAPNPSPVAARPSSRERGALLFGWKGCAVCHGPEALGNVGPRIARTTLPLEAVVAQVRWPRNAYMPAFDTTLLSNDEVADIYAFLESLALP